MLAVISDGSLHNHLYECFDCACAPKVRKQHKNGNRSDCLWCLREATCLVMFTNSTQCLLERSIQKEVFGCNHFIFSSDYLTHISLEQLKELTHSTSISHITGHSTESSMRQWYEPVFMISLIFCFLQLLQLTPVFTSPT